MCAINNAIIYRWEKNGRGVRNNFPLFELTFINIYQHKLISVRYILNNGWIQ